MPIRACFWQIAGGMLAAALGSACFLLAQAVAILRTQSAGVPGFAERGAGPFPEAESVVLPRRYRQEALRARPTR